MTDRGYRRCNIEINAGVSERSFTLQQAEQNDIFMCLYTGHVVSGH